MANFAIKLSCIVLFCSVVLTLGCGCDEDDTECGEGTIEVDGICIPIEYDGAVGADATMPLITCGPGTVERDNQCVAIDAGITMVDTGTPPPPIDSTVPPPDISEPIGAACSANDECESGYCNPATLGTPGGYCGLLDCGDDLACPPGSTCYPVTRDITMCMAYCDEDAVCRPGEEYVCQPTQLGVNICAPSCTVRGTCGFGGFCNEDTGICDLPEECDPGDDDPCDSEDTERICFEDPDGTSSEGGYCLRLCDPQNPTDKCDVDQFEVCQPIAEDPEDTGVCVPPVCDETEECPAGAICQDEVCQPPALCDDDGDCDDDDYGCVGGSGGACMPKCDDDDDCTDIHSGLACVDVDGTDLCVPIGSYPGSPCREDLNDECDTDVGDEHFDLYCKHFSEVDGDDVCVIDCSDGGDDLCQDVSDDLECFEEDGYCALYCDEDSDCRDGFECLEDQHVCLKIGAFPGSSCRSDDTCWDYVMIDGRHAKLICTATNKCVVDCSEHGEGICSMVDESLTCVESKGYCVKKCVEGACAEDGYSCLFTENACLPDGTFPGSACRSSGSACDSVTVDSESYDMTCSATNLCAVDCTDDGQPTCTDYGTAVGVTMNCVNNTCVTTCDDENNGDSFCQALNPALTCSVSAGGLCVPACNAGSCAAYPGTSCLLTENACLPNGSFPGSDCATGDVCSDTPPMACVDGTCVATCNDAAPETGDDYCEAINAILTCSASAGGLCLPACPGGNCDLFPGTSCLVKENENACLPNGSFPGSDCATGDVCSDTPIDMECVDGTCFATCDDGAGGDTFCAGISALLTCSVAAGGLCVPACDAGSCAAYPGTSCLLTENACLPNGSFPGSTCAAGDLCSQTPIPMVCITNTCLINCSSNAAICDAYGLVCDGTLLVCVEGGT